MADQLEYTAIAPKQGDEETLVFTLSRALASKEAEVFTDRRLTASGNTVEVPMHLELEPDIEDATRAAIGRVDVILRELAKQAELEAMPEAERPKAKTQRERIEAVAQAQIDKNAREKQGREREERERNPRRPGRG